MGSLLVTVATVILVAFNLLERNLRNRLEQFGVNTLITREMLSHNDPEAFPNLPRPDRLQPLSEHGTKISFRQLYTRANTSWQKDIMVMTYPGDALPLLAPLLHTNTPLICFSETLPEGALVEVTFNRVTASAVVRKVTDLFRPMISQSVIFIPQGWAPEAERLGYVDTTLFRRAADSGPMEHFVQSIRTLYDVEDKNPPQIQSALGILKELESLQSRQTQWRSAMAGMLGLAVALVFGAIAVLEFRQNAYISALLRSFGTPGKALYIRQWFENAFLANVAALSALVILASFHAELFGLFGFSRDLLDLDAINPYFSWEIALVLLWVNIGAFFSSLSVAIGLKKPVGEVLS